MSKRGTAVVVGVSAALGLSVVGCPGPGPIQTNNDGPNGNGGSDQCRLQIDSVSKTKLDVAAKLDYALAGIEGQANYDSFQEVKAGFDDMQKDFDLVSFKLCEDVANARVSQSYYETRRTCMDNALVAMRVMEKDLTNLSAENADHEKAWALESKIEWIREAVLCKDGGAGVPVNQAPTTTAGAPAAAPANVDLTAYLICQQKSGSTFVDVPTCDGAELKTGDRVRFGFKTAQPARLYILAYNSTGQFQMLFPDPGVDNESVPGADTFVPADDWFYLDDEVKGVTEIVQVVASQWKVPQLEAFRGKELPPQKPSESADPSPTAARKVKANPAAMKTRGLIEPIITRGFKRSNTKKPVRMSVGGDAVDTVPMNVSFPGAAAAEFRILHK